MTPRLHPDDLERLAELVAEHLAGDARPSGGLVDVRAVAALLGVSTDFVYSHARELGGIKLADSPRAPWRFDVDRAREVMAARTAAPAECLTLPRRQRSTKTTTSSGVPLLPIARHAE